MHTTIDLAPATSVLGRRTRGHFEQSYETQHGRPSGKGLYSESDWRRLDYMLSLMPAGGTVLDVGIGPGAFVQMLALSGRFDRVCGIDIRRSSKFVELCEFDFRKMTVERMSFEDDEFDTVVCMEVLEHVPMEVFGPALQELRRVAAKELLMTVPFEEPEPLPSYHKLRFEDADLDQHFPTAERTLLKKTYAKGVPWMLLRERMGGGS